MVTEMRRERPRCASLMIASPRMTAVASAASWATSARLASRIAASTRDPMRRTASRMRPSSRSSASRGAGVPPPLVPAAPCRRSSSWASMWVFPSGSLMSPTSAEPAGHVVLGQLLFGIGEDLDGVALLHYIAGVILGHVEEDRLVRRPCGLLHVVGHDDDRVALLDLRHQLLDLEGRPGVECGARLVHEDDLGIGRDRPGDAQPLLLAAGQRQPRLLELVLDLVPDCGPPQTLLDEPVEIALEPVQSRPEGDVVVDRFRERVRFLEDHPDPPPDLDRVHV